MMICYCNFVGTLFLDQMEYNKTGWYITFDIPLLIFLLQNQVPLKFLCLACKM